MSEKIACKYGSFSEDGREYVITDPYTPRPWINVISNGDYSFMVSQTGGGYSFRNNAEQNRLTRSFQDIVKDNWGKYFYIRDTQSGQYFSAALNPVRENTDFYRVRHGVGYSVFERKSLDVLSELTVFVSADKPVEFMTLKLTDLSGGDRALDVTSYFEWAPGLAYDNHREFQRLFSSLSFDEAHNAVLIDKCLWGFPDEKGRHNNDEWPFTGFFGCSEKASSFDTDKESFLGMYGCEQKPKAMAQKELDCTLGRYVDPVCSLRVPVTLKAGQSKTIVFVLGMAEKGKEDKNAFLKLASEAAAEKELADVHEFWNKLIFTESAHTPDPAFDIMTNVWSKYQALSCRMWAKAAYYQISGGVGYRDQLQDSLVNLETNPELTKKQILLHASKQFGAGDVLHWWLTIKSWGPRTKCSDDFLWLPYITYQYVLETGDYAVYDEVAPYLDGGEGSVYEHCQRAIDLSLSRFSPRGIPLMGDHDWNDGLSAVGNDMKGESFWVAEFLYQIMKDFSKVGTLRGDKKYAELMDERCRALYQSFNELGWDGEWFLQATNDLGDKVGSKENEEGKIFLNPQLWAVISDMTDSGRKAKALEAVKKYLLKDYGALLLSPEYRTPNKNIGYITRYAPGLRENGGVYTHAATWAVWAFALMGDAENAYKAYRGICPPGRSGDIDRFKSEPYVLPGNSDGPISPYYGKGGWSWYTGSAQWLHGVAVHWILGVRPCEEGLKISPCVPADWNGFEYERTWRGAKLKIKAVRTGKSKLTVDGKVISGDVVAPFKSGEHKIEVEF